MRFGESDKYRRFLVHKSFDARFKNYTKEIRQSLPSLALLIPFSINPVTYSILRFRQLGGGGGGAFGPGS